MSFMEHPLEIPRMSDDQKEWCYRRLERHEALAELREDWQRDVKDVIEGRKL